FCPCLQMKETNFEPFAVDYLLRDPGYGNTGTPRSHHHDVAIRSALQKTNVAVMREDFRPKRKIRCGVEDRCLRRVHDNGITLVHQVRIYDFKPRRRRSCAVCNNAESFLENLGWKRGK